MKLAAGKTCSMQSKPVFWGGVKSGLVLPDGFAGRGRAQVPPTGKPVPIPELPGVEGAHLLS